MCSGQGAPGTRPPPLQALFKRCDARVPLALLDGGGTGAGRAAERVRRALRRRRHARQTFRGAFFTKLGAQSGGG